jgi:hypothetical protein
MKMKKKSWTLLAVAILATLLLSGCWLFGITLVLSYDIDDKEISTDEPLNGWLVDLTTEQDWKDNQDKLDEIYILYFYGWIENKEGTPATGQLYVYKDTTLHTIAEVESLATLVLDGLVIPANSTVEVPLTAMKLEPIRDLIMKGKFALYAIATDVPFDIRVYDATVVVIFAVETIF